MNGINIIGIKQPTAIPIPIPFIEGSRDAATASDIKLKDVYKGNLENEMEQTMNDVVNHLKKQYKKITGNTLSLTPEGEVDCLVQSTSRVRVFVTAKKTYKVGGLDSVEAAKNDSKDKLDSSFRSFLDKGGFGSPPANKNQKGGQGKDSQKDG